MTVTMAIVIDMRMIVMVGTRTMLLWMWDITTAAQ